VVNAPETPLPPPQINLRTLRTVRGAALAMVVILSIAVVVVLKAGPWVPSRVWVALPQVLLMLPYLVIVFMLREKTRKRGLALTLWWSAIPVVIGLLVLGGTIVDGMEHGLERAKQEILDFGAAWGLAALFHAVMLGAAIKTYYSMPREAGDQRKLAEGLVGAALFFVLLFMAGADISRMMSLARLRE